MVYSKLVKPFFIRGTRIQGECQEEVEPSDKPGNETGRDVMDG